MYCKNCGQPLSDGANFCPACGTAQDDSNNVSSSAPARTNYGSSAVSLEEEDFWTPPVLKKSPLPAILSIIALLLFYALTLLYSTGSYEIGKEIHGGSSGGSIFLSFLAIDAVISFLLILPFGVLYKKARKKEIILAAQKGYISLYFLSALFIAAIAFLLTFYPIEGFLRIVGYFFMLLGGISMIALSVEHGKRIGKYAVYLFLWVLGLAMLFAWPLAVLIGNMLMFLTVALPIIILLIVFCLFSGGGMIVVFFRR